LSTAATKCRLLETVGKACNVHYTDDHTNNLFNERLMVD